uniref:Uncharacterized protein n=1 Tax=uncultured marine virus TaxID=186617 RepID=A0A0F7L477_9VIRU|nr:hypothetical protein [uncultured marine virus]
MEGYLLYLKLPSYPLQVTNLPNHNRISVLKVLCNSSAMHLPAFNFHNTHTSG